MCGGRLTKKTEGWNIIKHKPNWCFNCSMKENKLTYQQSLKKSKKKR